MFGSFYRLNLWNFLKRTLPQLAIIFLAFNIFTITFATEAKAHIDLVETTPAKDEIVPLTPDEINLTFNTNIDPESLKIDLYYRDGTNYPFITENGSYFTVNGKTATVKPPSLDRGTYVVTFSSSGPDGHISADQFHFSVGAPSGPAGDLRAQSPVLLESLQTASRWVLYLVFSLIFGLVFFRHFFKESQPARQKLDKLLKLTFKIALPLVVVRFIIVASIVSIVSGPSQVLTIFTTIPSLLGWLALFSAAIIIFSKPSFNLALLSFGLFALGDTLTGHLPYQNNGIFLVILATVHLAAVLLWIGLPLSYLLGYKTTKDNLKLFFKKTTIILAVSAALVVLTGPLMFVIRTGGVSLETLTTTYGLVVVVKSIIVSLVLCAGLIHILKRRSLDPADAGTLGDVTRNRKNNSIPLVLYSFKAEIILLLIAALFGAFLAGLNPKTVSDSSTDLLAAPQSYEECMDKEDEAGKFLCVSKYYETIATTESVSKAITEFSQKLQSNDPWVQSNCHQIGHKLGRIGWSIYGDIRDAFAQGSDPCDYGYLHGVIEGASAGFTEEELMKSMPVMCEEVPGGMMDHTYRQCIHGLGHAAARRVNNDIPKAMEFCRVFYKEGSTENTQSDLDWYKFNLCVTGISMEWNISPLAYESAAKTIGSPGTLLYECGQVDRIFAPGCVEYATTPFAGQVDKLIEILDWCVLNLEDPYPCYLSVGRDVMVPWVDYPDMLRTCESQGTGSLAEECVLRALGNIATRELSIESVDPVCEFLPERYDSTCRIFKEAMSVQLEQMTKGYILE